MCCPLPPNLLNMAYVYTLPHLFLYALVWMLATHSL